MAGAITFIMPWLPTFRMGSAAVLNIPAAKLCLEANHSGIDTLNALAGGTSNLAANESGADKLKSIWDDC